MPGRPGAPAQEYPYTCVVDKPDPTVEYYEARKNIKRKLTLLKRYDLAYDCILAAVNALTPNRTKEEAVCLKSDIKLGDTVDLTDKNFTKILIEGGLTALSSLNGKPMFKVSSPDFREHIAIEGLGGQIILDGAGLASWGVYEERTTAGAAHNQFSVRNLKPINFVSGGVYWNRIYSSVMDWIYGKNCTGIVLSFVNCWDDWITRLCATSSSGQNMKLASTGQIMGGDWYLGGSSSAASYQLEFNGCNRVKLKGVIVDAIYCTYGLGVTGSNNHDIEIDGLLISGPFRDANQVAMRVYNCLASKFRGRIDKKDSTYNWLNGIKEEATTDRNEYDLDIHECTTPITRVGANSIFLGFINDLPLKKLLENVSVGTTSTTIAHGLGITPNNIKIIPRSNAVVWRSANPDATNIYLQASAACSCDIYVSYE